MVYSLIFTLHILITEIYLFDYCVYAINICYLNYTCKQTVCCYNENNLYLIF